MKLGLGLSCRLLLLCLVCLSLGCGDDSLSTTYKEMNKLNMQKLANSYVMFASVNKGMGPKDAAELENFIKTDERVAPRLGMSSGDLGNVGDLFISDADGEPFQIRYGLKIRTDEDFSPLVFDKTGVDGMRRVARADNLVLEITDDKKYDQLWAGRSAAGPDKTEIDIDTELDE